MGKTACVAFCSGCPRSQVDASRLLSYLEANGWRISKSLARSGLVVISACAVSAPLEEESLRAISCAQRRRRSQSLLVVVGCIAGICEDRLRESLGAVVIPPMRWSALDSVIEASIPFATIHDPNDLEAYLGKAQVPVEGTVRSRLHRNAVRVQDALAARRLPERRHTPGFAALEPVRGVHSIRVGSGCLEHCSFCAVGPVEAPCAQSPWPAS